LLHPREGAQFVPVLAQYRSARSAPALCQDALLVSGAAGNWREGLLPSPGALALVVEAGGNPQRLANRRLETEALRKSHRLVFAPAVGSLELLSSACNGPARLRDRGGIDPALDHQVGDWLAILIVLDGEGLFRAPPLLIRCRGVMANAKRKFDIVSLR